MPEDQPPPEPQGRTLADLEGSVEDARSLFDELFGEPETTAPAAPSEAVPVAAVLSSDGGPETLAVRAVAAPEAQTVTAGAGQDEAAFWGEEDASAPKPARRARGRVKARKVRRIVRHIEAWSVLKVSLFFFLTLWLILLVAGVLIWSVAVNQGGVESIEEFIEKLMGYEDFAFLPDQIFRAYALGGLVVCVGLSAFSVIVTLIFNLISDLMGGIRVTVIEEERLQR